jgi:predicted kinase
MTVIPGLVVSSKDTTPRKTLMMTVGLPRSGKSTWVHRQDDPIVNPDAIRLALHGHEFIGLAEELVWAIAKLMVRALFIAGHDTVILDATNTSRKRRLRWKSRSWIRFYKEFDTSKEECIRRARDGGKELLVPVIERMAKEQEPIGEDEYDE